MVVATYNRSNVLRYALHSALSETHEDVVKPLGVWTSPLRPSP